MQKAAPVIQPNRQKFVKKPGPNLAIASGVSTLGTVPLVTRKPPLKPVSSLKPKEHDVVQDEKAADTDSCLSSAGGGVSDVSLWSSGGSESCFTSESAEETTPSESQTGLSIGPSSTSILDCISIEMSKLGLAPLSRPKRDTTEADLMSSENSSDTLTNIDGASDSTSNVVRVEEEKREEEEEEEAKPVTDILPDQPPVPKLVHLSQELPVAIDGHAFGSLGGKSGHSGPAASRPSASVLAAERQEVKKRMYEDWWRMREALETIEPQLVTEQFKLRGQKASLVAITRRPVRKLQPKVKVNPSLFLLLLNSCVEKSPG